MTTRDIATRLTQGRAAVDNTQCYVSAARQLGYQHPALTRHDRQIADWYDSEDGLDLRVLAGDCTVLWAGVAAADEALAIQQALTARLAVVWTGPGADAATAFLQRHCSTAAYLAASVRAAAEGCRLLGDNLGQIVATKVAAAIAIDDRRIADRPVWLAAARTLTGAAGDRETAEQVIAQQVIPYVDNDIRLDWLTAMQSARAAVADCYEATTNRIAALTPTHFSTPSGDLAAGHRLPVIVGVPVVPWRPLRPASVVGPPLAPDILPPGNPVAGPPNEAVHPPINPGPVGDVGGLDGAPAADWAGTSVAGSELPTGATGLGLLSGVGQLIANAISGLVGTAAAVSNDGAAMPPAGEPPGPDSTREHAAKTVDRTGGKADARADPKVDAEAGGEPAAKRTDAAAEHPDGPPGDLSDASSDGHTGEPDAEPAHPETPVGHREPDPADDPPAPADEGAPLPSQPPPPGDQPASPDAVPRTPCQTAADELPQVGQ